MFEQIWDWITYGAVWVGKLVFWQWMSITKKLVSLDLRLVDIEKSLSALREEHNARRICDYEEELIRVRQALERLEEKKV